MSQIGYRIVVIPVPPSRSLVSSFGRGILESLPRVTRSTPTSTPPAGTVPTVRTTPVSASPLATRDPKPGAGLLRGAEESAASPKRPTLREEYGSTKRANARLGLGSGVAKGDAETGAVP